MSTKSLKDLYVGTDYIPDEKFRLQKTASHKLTQNIHNWPIEILKILGEDYSWVTDSIRPASVDLENVDKEHGSGYGGIVVYQNAIKEKPVRRADPTPQKPPGPCILIPFTVRNYQLSPFDIFVSGKKILPLTPKRIQEEMSTAAIFSGVDKSKKRPSAGGLIGELSPPPDAFYARFGGRSVDGSDGSEGGGGMSVLGGAISPQDSLIMEQLLSTMSERERRVFSDSVRSDPASLAQFVKNQNVDILDRIIKARPITPDDQKNIARWAFPKNVILFEKIQAGKWRVTLMNDHYMVKDEVIGSERKLIEQMSGISNIADKLYSTDGFIVTVNHKEVQPVVWHENTVIDTHPASAPGVYLVVMANKSVEEGFIFDHILDYDGNRLPYKLFYDGDCFSVQEQMEGERLNKEWTHEEGFLKPGIWGTFLRKEENGEQHAVMPFKILATYVDRKDYPGTTMIRATDMFGHDVNFLLTRGIEKWKNATGTLSAELGDPLSSRAFWIPVDTQYVTLGCQKLQVMDSAREVAQGLRDTAMSSFSHIHDKSQPATALAVTCLDGGALYRLEGNIMQGLISVSGADLSPLRAKWVLVMVGCSVEDAQKILDKAKANHRTIVMNLRAPSPEANVRIDKQTDEVIKIADTLRTNLVKEAAYIRDKKSVDALLSLNFINPDNLIVFLQNLPKFREVEEGLSKLLLMARFGLEAVPEMAIENALKNLNLVNESLELLSGVVGNRMSAHGDMEFEEPEMPPGTQSTLE